MTLIFVFRRIGCLYISVHISKIGEPDWWKYLMNSLKARIWIIHKILLQITTMMCGSCSNENSFKLMYFKHMEKMRGGRDFNEEEMITCMTNQSPGTPKASPCPFIRTLSGFYPGSIRVLSWFYSVLSRFLGSIQSYTYQVL